MDMISVYVAIQSVRKENIDRGNGEDKCYNTVLQCRELYKGMLGQCFDANATGNRNNLRG